MVAGADSFEDPAVLRLGAMDRLLPGAPAPTTLGTHLRAYAFGHVRQLDADNPNMTPHEVDPADPGSAIVAR